MPDEGPGFFTGKHVAIFGLGLMGGSLAMALKGRCLQLTGIDPDPAVVHMALRRGIVSQAAVEPGRLLEDADVIILSAPVNAILGILKTLAGLTRKAAVVLDFGSTKRAVCQAMLDLPGQMDPIGAHPMCGKETGGLENAAPEIFRDAAFAIVPLERTGDKARETAEALASLLGSHPVWMDADSHDRCVAAISHLPYLVSNSLAFCTPLEAAPLAASGFASTTRLAVSSPDMMMDVLETNKDSILEALRGYRNRLALIEELLIRDDFERLRSELEAGAKNRRQIDIARRGVVL
jgi:prephenate dehydrogenase